MDKKKTQKVVREAYGKIAQGQEGCGCGTCGPDTKEFAKSIGYSEEELEAIPDEANLALSCGNPVALASPRCSLNSLILSYAISYTPSICSL